MTELKTLKDLCYNLRIENEDGTIEEEPCDGVVRESIVRAEAIKWVKNKYKLVLGDGISSPIDSITGEIGFRHFMEFFNLTEEDLNKGEENGR